MVDGKIATKDMEGAVLIGEKEHNQYVAGVIERAGKYSGAYLLDADGNRKYATDYCIENDIDLQKFIYFFRAVKFNPEVVEKVLHPKASSIRADILEARLHDLMIKSLG